MYVYTSIIANNIQGSARVINYAGLVRGATQRLVKLEITGTPNDELSEYITGILGELRSSEGNEYNLVKLEDADFQSELIKLSDIWAQMLTEIEVTRKLGYEASDLLTLSEEHFGVADSAVHFAEDYADELLQKSMYAKSLLISTVILLIVTLIFLIKKILKLKIENYEIEKSSQIDLPTTLPNKSRCHQMFIDCDILDTSVQYALIMFDLNFLKATNDALGHKFGDELIVNFATILKLSADKKSFVGRFGGDEFVVTYNDTSEEEVQAYISRVEISVNAFNSGIAKEHSNISFAVGYALSNYTENITFFNLFDEADKNMYMNKANIKKRVDEKTLR